VGVGHDCTETNVRVCRPSTLVLMLVDAASVPGYVDGYHVLNLLCTLFGLVYVLLPLSPQPDCLFPLPYLMTPVLVERGLREGS
jgi:hypothetical protein